MKSRFFSVSYFLINIDGCYLILSKIALNLPPVNFREKNLEFRDHTLAIFHGGCLDQ
jgi:hypothetical protein